MDDYWKKVGEDLRIAKNQRVAVEVHKRQIKSQHILDSKRGEWANAKRNKRRWPIGTSNVFNILIENKVRFIREKVIGIPYKSFRQPDFTIHKLKLFIEIGGPEHVKFNDDFREKQILSRPVFKDYKFFRIKSEIAADLNQARQALQPIILEYKTLFS